MAHHRVELRHLIRPDAADVLFNRIQVGVNFGITQSADSGSLGLNHHPPPGTRFLLIAGQTVSSGAAVNFGGVDTGDAK